MVVGAVGAERVCRFFSHDIKKLSQTWRDRLLGAAASAILTIAGLWFALVAGATVSYIFRG
jgi:hypothetical protein